MSDFFFSRSEPKVADNLLNFVLFFLKAFSTLDQRWVVWCHLKHTSRGANHWRKNHSKASTRIEKKSVQDHLKKENNKDPKSLEKITPDSMIHGSLGSTTRFPSPDSAREDRILDFWSSLRADLHRDELGNEHLLENAIFSRGNISILQG